MCILPYVRLYPVFAHVTLILTDEGDLDTRKMYLYTKNIASSQGFQTMEHEQNRQTERQTHTYTGKRGRIHSRIGG